LRWPLTAGLRRRDEARKLVERRWARVIEPLALIRHRCPDERVRLRKLCIGFLVQKRFEPAAGIDVDADLKLLVAAQACVPVLELGLDWYDDWISVIVYPGEFLARHEYVDESGVVHDVQSALCGEAWDAGPVLLSREGVLEDVAGGTWGNLVIHELAHKLDMRNGAPNGMPPLHRGMSRARWSEAFSAAFEDFDARVARGDAPWPDDAADDPAEFFAVASEAFFVVPGELAELYPRVYEALRDFYRQDPAARYAV